MKAGTVLKVGRVCEESQAVGIGVMGYTVPLKLLTVVSVGTIWTIIRPFKND